MRSPRPCISLVCLLALAEIGCGRGDHQAASPGKGDDAGQSKSTRVPAPVQPKALEKFAGGDDEARALEALASRPAWSAVIERHRLLGRRDQSGLVHGLLVAHEGALRLVDETEGQGSLSIPVILPAQLEFTTPQRVVLWGAWHSVQSPDFVWQATRAETLKPGEIPPEFPPGLVARDKEPPELLQLVSAVSKKGGAIHFTVHQRQDRIGDGWLVSDGPGLPPVARLLLPGEREPYGDQSRITESERWHLQGNHSYWLEIARFRPPSDGGLPVYRARTLPYRFTSPGDPDRP